MEERLPRKLAAILYADIVGYSRMAGEDEDATHRRLKESLDLLSRTVTSYHGQVINYSGDAALAMFEAVVDALSCAAAIQRDIGRLNQDVPREGKVQFRIGVNLGDVIEDGGDIFGEGVNVAARLESLAEPGGICISESVHTAVGSKLPLDYQDIGMQSVKNIAEPIRIYQANLKPGGELPRPSENRNLVEPPKIKKWKALTVTLLMVLIVLAGAAYWSKPWEPREEPATLDNMAFPLTDKPSIAVLPFANMSSDPEQEYFADGMTDDLITDLSKAAGLFVIARNSSFVYKGQNVDVRVIADNLGVRYVLEGSVRKLGDTVRINAQLIDAETGGHLWAERYDGRLDEIFIFQDGITEKIVAALAVKLSREEQQIIKKQDTVDIEAYELFLKGQERFFTYSGEGTLEAQELLGEAVARDPEFARAYAMLAWTHWFQFSTAQSDNPEASLQRAIELANLAIAANDTLPVAHFVKALVLRERREYAKAVAEAEKAIHIDPNYANGYVILATVLYYTGRAEEGLERIKKAMRLEPLHSQNFIWHLGQAYFILGRYDEAIETFQKALEKNPVSERTKLWLAAAYAQVGQIGNAEFELEEVLLFNPNLTMERIGRAYPFWYYADLENFLDGLSKAGLE